MIVPTNPRIFCYKNPLPVAGSDFSHQVNQVWVSHCQSNIFLLSFSTRLDLVFEELGEARQLHIPLPIMKIKINFYTNFNSSID